MPRTTSPGRRLTNQHGFHTTDGGQGAAVGLPFGVVLHRQARFVRKAPPHLHRQVRASDLALNQLRFKSIARRRFNRFAVNGFVVGLFLVSSYLVVTM